VASWAASLAFKAATSACSAATWACEAARSVFEVDGCTSLGTSGRRQAAGGRDSWTGGVAIK